MLLRNFFPFNRRGKKKRTSLDSKAPKRRKSDLPVYPSHRSAFQKRPRKRMKRFALWGAGLAALVLAWFYFTLPNINDLARFTRAPSILIKSEDGQIIGSSGDIYGDYIPYAELPASLADAVVATEDRNFYHHYGIDPFGIARAMVANIHAGHVVQGGSTITQQVAKNVFLTPERSFSRKLREVLLALKLERRFSKQEIMSIYLNRVYLGAGNYGVDAAAKRYFGKSARDLTLSESAIIAGLLKAPSRFAPTSNPQLSKHRAEQVLINMADAGYLTEHQADRAREELSREMAAQVQTAHSTLYFTDWILDQIPDYVGNLQDDIVVTTTLKPELQLLAEKTVAAVMDKEGATHDASQAALLSMTPDGAVRAMIGGRSYAGSQYNRATQALRQPGSAFKLFVYLAALEAGLSPDTMVEDKPVSIRIVGGTWEPKNYTNKYLGEISLRDAVAESVNTVAVQVAMQVGLDHVIDMARRLGITSDMDAVPSIALGATEVSLLELTDAYAHLAAGGALVYPYGIVSIDTAQGQPIFQRHVSYVGQALRSGTVGQMNELLLGVVENGTGKAARIGRPVAGKTGTTSEYRDAWFIGFAPQLVTGVWVGNDDNAEMKKVTGGMLPAMIWHDYMQTALANAPVASIPTGGLFSSLSLPWSGGDTNYPSQPGSDRNEDRKEGDANGVTLGPEFWNKLMR